MVGIHAIDAGATFHNAIFDYWNEKAAKNVCVIPNRFNLHKRHKQQNKPRNGDEICAKMRSIFLEGYGLKFSEDQVRVFNAFQNACLPLIYGDDWSEQKARVLRERKLDREESYTLVNMARRNGKTFSVAAAAAALVLSVPGCKIAIFSTCRRTSQMMLQAVSDMFDRAFKNGTHVKQQDFFVLSRNMETICFQGPDGTRRTVNSYPGSAKAVQVRERVRERSVGLHSLDSNEWIFFAVFLHQLLNSGRSNVARIVHLATESLDHVVDNHCVIRIVTNIIDTMQRILCQIALGAGTLLSSKEYQSIANSSFVAFAIFTKIIMVVLRVDSTEHVQNLQVCDAFDTNNDRIVVDTNSNVAKVSVFEWSAMPKVVGRRNILLFFLLRNQKQRCFHQSSSTMRIHERLILEEMIDLSSLVSSFNAKRRRNITQSAFLHIGKVLNVQSFHMSGRRADT